MANKTIGQLDSAATAESADFIEIEQSGVSKYASIDQILNNEGRLMSASGIKFPAVQVASADVNTLDDYEEGTWDPVYEPGSGALGTTVYTRTGLYTKIGRIVHIECFIRTTELAIGTAGSGLFIGGLPFANNSVRQSACAVTHSATFAGEAPNGGYISATQTRITLSYKTAADGSSTVSGANDLTTGVVAAANYISAFASYSVD